MWRIQSLAGKKGSVVRERSKVKDADASLELSLIRRISKIRSQLPEIAPRREGTCSSGNERELTA